jgi:pseudaminic acid biosynthesis-associated methylase
LEINTLKKKYKTEQEAFWAGQFGKDYISRNNSDELLASNLDFFSKSLKATHEISSVIEFGANVGMNLKAMELLFPDIEINAVEINQTAVNQFQRSFPNATVHHQSILDFDVVGTSDLVLIKGVLIHINPAELNYVYEKLHASSHRYILLAEYYNPSPVSLSYRGNSDRLYKRDFAGEMLDKYDGLRLVDYGFAYHRDPKFPQDDISWFLLEKSKS